MKLIRKFGDARHGWRGLVMVWREEWHFKYQIGIAVLGFSIASAIGGSPFELLLFFCALCIALASEIINTAIEDICNKFHPEYDPKIGAIKDMAQAFVILASTPAAALFFWIVLS